MRSTDAKDYLKELILLDQSGKGTEDNLNITPMVWGGAGVAKTAIIKQLARELNMEVIVVRLNTLSPVDVRGIPYADAVKEVAKFFPPEFLPKENPEIDGVINHRKVLIFFDEINTAPAMTQSVCYEIAHERTMGNHKMPIYTSVILAGNRSKDKGVTNTMPQPLANRCVHIEMDANADDFIAYTTSKEHPRGLNDRIHAFLAFRPDYIHKDHIENYKVAEIPAFPSYRTWEMLSAYLDSLPVDFDYTASVKTQTLFTNKIISFIGQHVAKDLFTFLSYEDKLPNLDDILIKGVKDFETNERGVQCYLLLSLFLRLEKYKNDKNSKYNDKQLLDMFDNYLKTCVRIGDKNKEISALGISLIRSSKNNTFYYRTQNETNKELMGILNSIIH